jgi:hypothetical protein
MLGKVQFVDDLGPEQAQGVREGGEVEPGI